MRSCSSRCHFRIPINWSRSADTTSAIPIRPGRSIHFRFPNFSNCDRAITVSPSWPRYRDKGFAFSNGAEVQNLRGQRVTGNFFTTLGIEPALGRVFQLEDEQAGGGPGGLKVVLSNEFWQRQFNADPNVLGRQLIAGSTIVHHRRRDAGRISVSDPGGAERYLCDHRHRCGFCRRPAAEHRAVG